MSTPNYAWSVPVVSGSVDTWGNILNATLVDVDNVVFTNFSLSLKIANNLSDVANATTARTNIGAHNASNLTTGTIPSGRVSGSYTSITGTGALNAGSIASGFGNINIGSSTFTGNGSGLTALNASNLSTGTIASARVSGSYTGITGTGTLGAGAISSGFGNINIGSSTFTGNGSGITSLPIVGGTTGTLTLARGGTGATNASGARSALELGTSATVNTGTSGAVIPLLNGNNTHSGSVTFSGSVSMTSSVTVSSVIARSGQGGHLYHNNSARSGGAVTVSTGTPSGGSNGDIWLEVP